MASQFQDSLEYWESQHLTKNGEVLCKDRLSKKAARNATIDEHRRYHARMISYSSQEDETGEANEPCFETKATPDSELLLAGSSFIRADQAVMFSETLELVLGILKGPTYREYARYIYAVVRQRNLEHFLSSRQTEECEELLGDSGAGYADNVLELSKSLGYPVRDNGRVHNSFDKMRREVAKILSEAGIENPAKGDRCQK